MMHSIAHMKIGVAPRQIGIISLQYTHGISGWMVGVTAVKGGFDHWCILDRVTDSDTTSDTSDDIDHINILPECFQIGGQ
jgi:hypothetical protein